MKNSRILISYLVFTTMGIVIGYFYSESKKETEIKFAVSEEFEKCYFRSLESGLSSALTIHSIASAFENDLDSYKKIQQKACMPMKILSKHTDYLFKNPNIKGKRHEEITRYIETIQRFIEDAESSNNCDWPPSYNKAPNKSLNQIGAKNAPPG